MIDRKFIKYTKANGDVSKRQIIVISAPKANYLVYDVTKLEEKDILTLLNTLNSAKEFKDDLIGDFETETGIYEKDLWRSFKPEGIDWDNEI